MDKKITSSKLFTRGQRLFSDVFVREKSTIIRLEIGLLLLIVSKFFFLSEILRFGLQLAAFILCAIDVFTHTARDLGKRIIVSPNTLCCIAAVAMFIIGRTGESVISLIIFELYKLLEKYYVTAVKNELKRMKNPIGETVTLADGDEVTQIPVYKVKPCDLISVAPGEVIAVDGEIVSGESILDISGITGETALVSCGAGDAVISGSKNIKDTLIMKAGKSYANSYFAISNEIISKADNKKSFREKLFINFSKLFPVIIFLISVIIGLVIPLLTGGDYERWIYRGCVLLIAAYPTALIVSVPLCYTSGILRSAREGIIFKSNAAFDTSSNLTSVVFDKTGTIASGEYKIVGIYPVKGMDEQTVLKMAVYADHYSSHPIAASVRKYANIDVNEDIITEHYEIRGQGSVVVLNGTTRICAGNPELMENEGISFEPSSTDAAVFYVAVGGKYAGRIDLIDSVKYGSADVVDRLRSIGVVNVALMTGDNTLSATRTGNRIGITEIYADCLPEDKVERLKYLVKMENGSEKMAYIGDGITDIPMMEACDLGIAIDTFDNFCREDFPASDILINSSDPMCIPGAIEEAKLTSRTISENIIASVGTKVILMVLGICGAMPVWLALMLDSFINIFAIKNASQELKLQ